MSESGSCLTGQRCDTKEHSNRCLLARLREVGFVVCGTSGQTDTSPHQARGETRGISRRLELCGARERVSKHEVAVLGCCDVTRGVHSPAALWGEPGRQENVGWSRCQPADPDSRHSG